MWTLYGLAEIGTLTGAIVRRWQSRSSSDDRRADGVPEDGLLWRRMKAMDVDADTFARLEPALYGNLQTLCGQCEHPNLCRHDLRHDPANTAWEDYCPDAVVLNAIKELRWFHIAPKGDM
jgi:hypothetical protein